MDNKLFDEIIASKLGFLKVDGYSFRGVDRNVWFEKNTESAGFRIGFAYTEYGQIFHIKGLKASKRFNEIENVLQKVLGGNLVDYYTVYISPNEREISPGLLYKKTENNFHFEIANADDLYLFLKFVESFYEKIHSFYNSYETLSQVYDKIKELSKEHLSRFVSNSNNLLFARVYLVKSCCDKSEGEAYFSEIDKELNKMRGNKTIESISDILNSVKRRIEI